MPRKQMERIFSILNFRRFASQINWLKWARLLVIAFAVFQLGIALLGTIQFKEYVSTSAENFALNHKWTYEETSAALKMLGWPAHLPAWVALSRDWLSLLTTSTIAFILLRQKSLDGFRLFLALVFLVIGVNTGTAMDLVLQRFPPLNQFYNGFVGVFGWQFFFIAFFLFPDGRPSPSWTRWLIRAWLALMVVTLAFPSLQTAPVVNSIMVGIATLLVIMAIGSQVYRQIRQSSPVQKQQTKWVVAALVLSMVLLMPLSIFGLKPPAPDSLSMDMLMALLFQVMLGISFTSIYVSILIAILRYRLYDIDVIIRRTLVYGTLTMMLGLGYLGGITVLQSFFSNASGQHSPLSIVLSTLMMAALFNPLRKRIQKFIDMRFYRTKYNAEQALEAFAWFANRETDMAALSQQLIGVVRKTVQPEHADLWIVSDR